MGAGKSSVGEKLAALLGYEWVDLDAYIEKKIGLNIPEIFKEKGEDGFRAVEAEAIRDLLVMHILTHSDMVLSLGGGSLEIGALRDYILENSLCVYLETSPKALTERIKKDHAERPVLKKCADIAELLQKREKNYKLAQETVRTDERNVEQVTQTVYDIVKRGTTDDERV